MEKRATATSAEHRRAWNDVQAAEYVGHSVKTLRKMRLEHRGPAYLKLGRSVRYLQADLDAWLESSRIDPAA